MNDTSRPVPRHTAFYRALTLGSVLLVAGCAGGPAWLSRPAPVAAQTDTSVEQSEDTGPYADLRPPLRPGDPAPEFGAETGANPGAEVASAAAPATGGDLGTTIASLGNAAEPGIWLKTPLVRSETQGQVSYQGKNVTARLIPIEGPATAGSRASLQLMQQLGAPLTGLPEFRVSR